MATCSTNVCGTGGWGGPLPGDPDNNSVLSATPAFGGIDVSWIYPATNPYAVAHVLLYRGILPDFNSAMFIATVGGNFFYDKSTVNAQLTYYYWIKIVSVNGTIGALIGPASAVAKPTIDNMIELLTDKIDAGSLAQSLKTELGKITLNYAELVSEVSNRVAANNALSAALATVQSGVNSALTYISQEVTSRQDGDSALVTQVNSVAAANASNLALIQQEQTARVTADNSLSLQISTVAATAATNAASIITEQQARASADSALATSISNLSTAANNSNKTYSQTTAPTGTLVIGDLWFDTDDTNKAYRWNGSAWVLTADTRIFSTASTVSTIEQSKIGYSALASDSATPFDGDGTTIVYSVASYPTATYPEYAVNRTRILDKVGVINWNVTLAGVAKPLVWLVGFPLATSIKRVGVTGPSGEVASLETALTAQKTLNDGFKAMYTVKLNTVTSTGEKIVGGFNLYADATGVEAGFDVDKFWIGRTDGTKKKPFIVSGGQVYIDQAVINTLTFTKLRDESGLVMVENGKIKADYLKVNEILGGSFASYAWPASGTGFYLGPSGLLLGNYTTGKWFQVEANGNIAAPGFNVTNGIFTISELNVIKTANIAGNAVTTVQSFSFTTGPISPVSNSNSQWTGTAMYVNYPSGNSGTVFLITVQTSNPSGGTNLGIRIRRSDSFEVMANSVTLAAGSTDTNSFIARDTSLTGSSYYQIEVFNDWFSGGPFTAIVKTVMLGMAR